MCKGVRFPWEVIAYCVWLYHRFTLSFREIELLMAERGVDVTYETIRTWCARFGPEYARRLRRRSPRTDDSGISMRCSSTSAESGSACGGRSISTATYSTSSSKGSGTGR